MGLLDDLIRPNIRDLDPYSSAREQHMDFGLILLDANENSRGSVGVADNPWSLHRYPDPYQRAVKSKLARIWDHPIEGIFFGNGSDEIIDLLIRIFCEPSEDEILVTAPTYGMYKVAAHINNVTVSEVSLTDNFDLDADSLMERVKPNTKVIFLCSPNNPTGNLLSEDQIIFVLNKFKGIVVIDEAYIDFAQSESFIGRCQAFPRMVVTQTFSKAWGLAGIRLGVCFTSPEVAHYLNRAKPPYNVNQLTQQQALIALEAHDEMKRTVHRILEDRNKLAAELKKLSLVKIVYPSDANFLLVCIRHVDEVFRYLIEKQVIVRNRSRVHLCEGCLRITVGDTNENSRLLEALNTFQL